MYDVENEVEAEEEVSEHRSWASCKSWWLVADPRHGNKNGEADQGCEAFVAVGYRF